MTYRNNMHIMSCILFCFILIPCLGVDKQTMSSHCPHTLIHSHTHTHTLTQYSHQIYRWYNRKKFSNLYSGKYGTQHKLVLFPMWVKLRNFSVVSLSPYSFRHRQTAATLHVTTVSVANTQCSWYTKHTLHKLKRNWTAAVSSPAHRTFSSKPQTRSSLHLSKPSHTPFSTAN